MAHVNAPSSELPDPFCNRAGERVSQPAQWAQWRRGLHTQVVPAVYGVLPAAPRFTGCTELHTTVVARLQGARLSSLRLEVEGRHLCLLKVFVPAGDGPFAVLLNGDGCWAHATDAVIAAIVARGYAFAQFNRVEVAPDMPDRQPRSLHLAATPAAPCPALAAWAWAYHRAVDALIALDWVNQEQIAVVGHSRGGKAALLAGATDERISLTSANNSGAGGAGSFCCLGAGAETLGDVTRVFPHWFAPTLAHFAGREDRLGFDQHFLLSLIAPRALLTTEAMQDHWANPIGSWQIHRATREVYRFLAVPGRIATSFRQGGHTHDLVDWLTLLDFCDFVFRGAAFPTTLQQVPYPGLPPAHSWSYPGSGCAP